MLMYNNNRLPGGNRCRLLTQRSSVSIWTGGKHLTLNLQYKTHMKSVLTWLTCCTLSNIAEM